MLRSPLEHRERFCSKKRGDFNFIFCSVDTLTAHIVLFSQNKKIKPTCSPWIFSPLRTVRDSAEAEVDRELGGVLHGQPQSQPCSERCCLQQRSGDFSLCFHRPLPSLCRPKPSQMGDELQRLTFFFSFSLMYLSASAACLKILVNVC